jgi:imidazolonepropionase-like amidohydrolase
MKTRALGAGLLFLSAGAWIGAQEKTAAPPPRVFSIVGATIHPVSGPDIAGGTIVVRDGRIASVSPGAAPEPGAPVVDGKGKHVYPSLFPPMTVLGLEEIESVRSTLDTEELGGINPAARADVAINYDSELLPVARSGGVLVAGVTPTGGIIAGTAVATRLDGWTREDATLKAPAAITVYWPDLRIDRSPGASRSVKKQEKARDEAVERLKKAFRDARAYARARGAERTAGIPKHDFDPRLEALRPALDGAIPVVVNAQRLAQIRDAVKWAAEEKLRLVIWGGADAWRMADELAKAGVPVILESPLDLPVREDDAYDSRFTDAAVLERAGVRVAFNEGGADASNVRNFAQLAAMSVAFGYPREKAVAALTLEPARILGVDGRIGSLEPGKDATLILTDGDILDLRSRVVGAYLDGRPLDLTDKQKQLYERYRNRPKPGGVTAGGPPGGPASGGAR